MIKSILASLVLIAAAAPAGLAQNTGKAATREEMNTYTVMSATTLCQALQQGMTFDKAVQVGAVGFYSVLAQKHAYKIDQPDAKKPLTPEQLEKGVVNATVVAAMSFCKDRIPKETQDRVQKAAEAAK